MAEKMKKSKTTYGGKYTKDDATAPVKNHLPNPSEGDATPVSIKAMKPRKSQKAARLAKIEEPARSPLEVAHNLGEGTAADAPDATACVNETIKRLHAEVEVLNNERLALKSDLNITRRKLVYYQDRGSKLTRHIEDAVIQMGAIQLPEEAVIPPPPKPPCTCSHKGGKGRHHGHCELTGWKPPKGVKRVRPTEELSTIAKTLERALVTRKHMHHMQCGTSLLGADFSPAVIDYGVEVFGSLQACADFFGVSRSTLSWVSEKANRPPKSIQKPDNTPIIDAIRGVRR